jgi:LPS sulfotransferase NodH
VDPRVAASAIANDAAADRCFIVCFTPRSGSSWLTRIVSATKKLGALQEYINPDFVRDVAKEMHSTHQATMLAMLKRWTATPNGVFSMETRATDIELFGEADFFIAFDSQTVFFYLWRDNIVAQGISLYRAVTTNRFHSSDAPVAAPSYEPDLIAEWMRHIVQIENENLVMLQRNGRYPRFLRYEDIIRHSKTTLAIIADAVRVDLTTEQSSVSESDALTKIADEWNGKAEQNFRAERRDFILDLEERRLIRR